MHVERQALREGKQFRTLQEPVGFPGCLFIEQATFSKFPLHFGLLPLDSYPSAMLIFKVRAVYIS